MRHLTVPLSLALVALALPSGLAGCLPSPATFRPGPELGASLAVRPEVARRVLAVVPRYTQDDVANVRLRLYTWDGSTETQVKEALVPANKLGNVITFAHLRHETHYRVRAWALDSGSAVISQPSGGAMVDLTTSSNRDDTPPAVTIPIQLKDKPFAAGGTTGLVVREGGYRPYGFVSTHAILTAPQSPGAIVIDNEGLAYVADPGQHCIYELDATGAVTATIGTPGTPGLDNFFPNARFDTPKGLALQESDDGSVKKLYVADSGNDVIRVIDLVSNQIETYAGDGTPGYNNDQAALARFMAPEGLSVSREGHLIIADTGNHVIRYIDPELPATDPLKVVTVAGPDDTASPVAGYMDQPGSSARFNTPTGVFAEKDFIYVVDSLNHAVRRIRSGDRKVTTFAGGNQGYVNAQGLSAKFNRPIGLAVSSDGMLFVTDRDNHAIRMITPEQQVTTLAGDLSDPPASGLVDATGTAARFDQPLGIAISSAKGEIFVSDGLNARIRKLR